MTITAPKLRQWTDEETKQFLEAASLASTVAELRELLEREPACLPLRTVHAYLAEMTKRDIDNPTLAKALRHEHYKPRGELARGQRHAHVYVSKSRRREIVARIDEVVAASGKDAKHLCIALGLGIRRITRMRGRIGRGENVTHGALDDLSETLGKPRLWLRLGRETERVVREADRPVVAKSGLARRPLDPYPRWASADVCANALGIGRSTVINSSGRIPHRGRQGQYQYSLFDALTRLRDNALRAASNKAMAPGASRSVAMFMERHGCEQPIDAARLAEQFLREMNDGKVPRAEPKPRPTHKPAAAPAEMSTGTITVRFDDAPATPSVPPAADKSARLLGAVLSGVITVEEARLLIGAK